MIWYDIYLTAIGLTPGGSITRHIYYKQYTQYIESTILEVRAVPRLCELYPDICLTTEGKTLQLKHDKPNGSYSQFPKRAFNWLLWSGHVKRMPGYVFPCGMRMGTRRNTGDPKEDGWMDGVRSVLPIILWYNRILETRKRGETSLWVKENHWRVGKSLYWIEALCTFTTQLRQRRKRKHGLLTGRNHRLITTGSVVRKR